MFSSRTNRCRKPGTNWQTKVHLKQAKLRWRWRWYRYYTMLDAVDCTTSIYAVITYTSYVIKEMLNNKTLLIIWDVSVWWNYFSKLMPFRLDTIPDNNEYTRISWHWTRMAELWVSQRLTPKCNVQYQPCSSCGQIPAKGRRSTQSSRRWILGGAATRLLAECWSRRASAASSPTSPVPGRSCHSDSLLPANHNNTELSQHQT